MADLSTTKMSSKGQVVIPEDIRKRLGLEAGTRFVVVGEGDTVILKMIAPPDMDQFDELIARARAQARQVGLRRSDISSAVERVRSRP
jgi:AbrB family looped-hinge helix DNA binding protein